MLRKLPIVIAVELIILVSSFLLAGDKASFSEIASVYMLLTLLSAFSYCAFKLVNNLMKA